MSRLKEKPEKGNLKKDDIVGSDEKSHLGPRDMTALYSAAL